MTDRADDAIVVDECSNLRQGDIVDIQSLPFPSGVGCDIEEVATPRGVAVLSQTCDVVQPSKVRCLVAPVLDATGSALTEAKKGRKPLHLYLESTNEVPSYSMADMEKIVSVPKEMLVGRKLIARYVDEVSSVEAGLVGARVGRAFNRFPFPDEVYPVFLRLRSRIQSKSGTESAFGKVIDLVEDLRVSSDQWSKPGRSMCLYIIVGQELLIPLEDNDPSWEWRSATVEGLRGNESQGALSLNRICELILGNVSGNRTTLAQLWFMFGQKVADDLLIPQLNEDVISFDVEVLSDTEMTYRQFQRTESLDLEVLSDSKIAG